MIRQIYSENVFVLKTDQLIDYRGAQLFAPSTNLPPRYLPSLTGSCCWQRAEQPTWEMPARRPYFSRGKVNNKVNVKSKQLRNLRIKHLIWMVSEQLFFQCWQAMSQQLQPC